MQQRCCERKHSELSISVLPLELRSAVNMFVVCDTCLQATGKHFPARPLNVVSRNLRLTSIHRTKIYGPLSCHAGTVPTVAKIDVCVEGCVMSFKIQPCTSITLYRTFCLT